MTHSEYMNLAAAAIYLGVSHRTLKRMLTDAHIEVERSRFNASERLVKKAALDRLKDNPIQEAEAMTA